MKFILMFFILCFSCSYKIKPGKYVNSGIGEIVIDSQKNYEFHAYGEISEVFSKGEVEKKDNIITFLPDSSFYFTISVKKYFNDFTLKNKRKIIIAENDSLSDFSFYFSTRDSLVFFSNYSVIYNPQNDFSNLVLLSKIKDVNWPRPKYDSLRSNPILIEDVNIDDPSDSPWNVLVLTVHIDRDMYNFVSLENFVLKKNDLIQQNWPVFKLTK